ncbi:MAG: U32 family peptidase [Ruminococcaceae bacterium]|nr:U32 family peptidase [Oscillospiraceae bacterium]
MNHQPTIPEVLSPVGDEERLEYALQYGADAVYLSGEQFGMRAACANFDRESLARAVKKTHDAGKKMYVTCNILPRNKDIDLLPEYFSFLNDIGADALIISDLGTMELAKTYAPNCALHVSTQFGVVNHATANALHRMGAKRVVLARELSLEEIRTIRENTPPELELEAFVHGAICMSFSGRCVISNYLTNRDANHGECSQPCRWKYNIVEETRPDLPMTLEQDENGTYLFNANDMNMIAHVAALAGAGISSFKIEGRAKTFYYTAVTANAYRHAVDGYVASGFSPDYVPEEWILEEMNKISHRPYGTGFYFGMPAQHLKQGGYIRAYEVAAVVDGWENGLLSTTQRNRFFPGTPLDVLEPGERPFTFTPEHLYNEQMEEIQSANHAVMRVFIPFERPLKPGTLLRYKKH